MNSCSRWTLMLFLLLTSSATADTSWPCDLTHVKLRLTVDPTKKRMEGVATLDLRASKAGLRVLQLKAAKSIKVLSVTSNKRKLFFAHKAPRLVIHLKGLQLEQGSPFTIDVRYKVCEPTLGAYFVGPDHANPHKPWQLYTQSEPYEGHHWFPGYHEPDDKATSETVLRVPPGFTAISNGRLIEEKADGQWQTFHWRQQVPHSTYLISVMVGRYQRVVIRSKHPVPMAYYTHKRDAAEAGRSFTQTSAMMFMFEKLTGMRYPFSKYDQVLVDDYKWGGMEHSSATTLSARTVHDERAALDMSSEGLVAHELAHQWFGDALTCRSYSHLWLNEGFATYLAHLWQARRHGVDRMRIGLDRSKGGYMGAEDKRALPVVRLKYKKAISLFDRRSYGKGAWVLHMLQHVLGHDVFWKGIRRYTKRHWLKTVVTANLRQAMEEVSGQRLDWFFKQWVLQPGYPKFRVGRRYVAGELMLTVEQTQQGKQIPVFRTPIDIAVRVNGKRVTRRFELSQRKEVLRWPLAARPEYVRFNDGGWVLCRVEFKKSLKELILQATTDACVLGRLRALERMHAHRSRLDAQEALGRVLSGDSSFALRQKAAEILIAAGGQLSLSLLRQAAEDSSSKVRAAVVKGLRKFSGPESEAVLRRRLCADRSYWVVAESLKSLVGLRVKDAGKLLTEYGQLPSHGHLYPRTALQCRAELGGAADLKVVFAAIASGASQAVRREAVGLLPRFVNNHGDLVRKKLLALIGSAQVQLRRQAAGVMGRLADPATLEALKQAAKTDSDQQVRRAAKKAVDRINKELKKAGDLATQQVELKKQLQRKQLEVQKAQLDLEILEKRLKRLEIERKLKGK